MRIELECPRCDHRFAFFPGEALENALERMTQDDSWFALGDGETFEDSLHAALTDHGVNRCPECGEETPVNEDCLGQLTTEILAQW